MHTKLRRSVMALATVVAVLTLTASPTPANSTHRIDITDGTLTVQGTEIQLTTRLGGADSANCGTRLDVDVDHTATTSNVTIDDVTGRFRFIRLTTAYIAVLTISPFGNSSGSLSGGTITDLGVGFNMRIHPSAGTPDCITGGDAFCTMFMPLVFSGTYTSTTNPSITSNDTGTLTTAASTSFNLDGCCDPFANLNGATVTTADLTHKVTT